MFSCFWPWCSKRKKSVSKVSKELFTFPNVTDTSHHRPFDLLKFEPIVIDTLHFVNFDGQVFSAQNVYVNIVNDTKEVDQVKKDVNKAIDILRIDTEKYSKKLLMFNDREYCVGGTVLVTVGSSSCSFFIRKNNSLELALLCKIY